MKNLSLKGKILMLATFMSAVSVTIGVVSYYYSSKTSSIFTEIVKQDVPTIRALNRALLAFRMARIEVLHLSVNGTTKEFDEEAMKVIFVQKEKFDGELKNIAPGMTTDEEKAQFAEFTKHSAICWDDIIQMTELYKKNSSEGSPERIAMIKMASGTLAQHGAELRKSTEAILGATGKGIEEKAEAALAADKSGTFISVLLALFGCLAGITISFLFATKISKQISAIVGALSESSDQVASASAQIASSSEELSQAATEQAASLEETAASLEEITTMIGKASENASATGSKSSESQGKAEQGRAAMDQMMTSMDEISQSNTAIMNQVNQSNAQMSEIIKVIQDIGNKTKVINEIVFQTKLLSFNASVEAARAGEHGKGFAVVAEEVGNLAQMSGNAAKEITEMLESSIAKVELMVTDTKSKVETLVEAGREKVETGINTARQCSGVLDEIVLNVTTVTGLAQQISQAAEEQSQGVGEINKAMSQLDSVTQQNSATSEEAASAAEELSAQAETLKSAVQDLVVAVEGQAGHLAGHLPAHSAHSATVAPKAARKSNVVPMKKAGRKAAPAKSAVHAKVVGHDMQVPSRDDEGFQDF